MNWFLSIVSGVVCAAAGAVCAGYIANSCVEWYRISSREGASGYFVVFMGLLGLVAGFLIGIITARMAGAGGPAKGFGLSLGIVVGIAAIVWLLARLNGEVPPTLRGDNISILAELKCPPGWQPANKLRAGYSELRLDSIGADNVLRSSGSGRLSVAEARQEGGRWIIPGSVYLYTTTGRRALTFSLGGAEVANFLTSLPARPDESHEKWTDWLPRVPDSDPVAGGFRYRYRVQRHQDMRREEEAREEVQAAEHRNKLSALAASPEAQVRALQSADREQVMLALESFQSVNGIPAECVAPLKKVGAFVATSIRQYRESANPQDPDAIAAANLKQLFMKWVDAWERAMREHNAGIPSELDAIAKEAGEAASLDSEIKAIVSLCNHYREQWGSK